MVKVVSGEGMPSDQKRKGDLYVRFEVQFPKSLEEAQIAKMSEALGYERNGGQEEDVVETVTMEDVDPSQLAEANRNRRMSEESESRDEEYGDYRDERGYGGQSNQQECSIM